MGAQFRSYEVPVCAAMALVLLLPPLCKHKLKRWQGGACLVLYILYLAAVLLLPLWLHCAGVEMSQPVADLLTFVISMPFLAAFYRHHIRGHAE